MSAGELTLIILITKPNPSKPALLSARLAVVSGHVILPVLCLR